MTVEVPEIGLELKPTWELVCLWLLLSMFVIALTIVLARVGEHEDDH